MPKHVTKTRLKGVKLFNRGKVRDIYDLGDKLLIIATDRLSAFDVVLPDPIPGKGKLLTSLSAFWCRQLKAASPNHVITTDTAELPPKLAPHAEVLDGRFTLVRKAEVIPVECVIRGYLAGSGWASYQESGEVCGIKLAPGLQNSSKLPEPIFTPTTKAKSGHDEPITFEDMAEALGAEIAEELRDRSMALYNEASAHARERGVIIADTKFEWGMINGKVVLVDEVLTPDSSRFWPADEYEPGRSQNSFDKQIVRNYLETLDWDKTAPGPKLPAEIIERTSARYAEVAERLINPEQAQNICPTCNNPIKEEQMPTTEEEIKRYQGLFPGIQGKVQLLLATQDRESFACREARLLFEEAASLTAGKAQLHVLDFTKDSEEIKRFDVERIPGLVFLGERDNGIRFYGVPSGYLFTTLLEAILLVGRGEVKLGFDTQAKLAAVKSPMHLKVFVTPMCPDSPQVVTLAQRFAYVSDFIRADIIDITSFPHLAIRHKIKSVPHIILDPKRDPIIGPQDETGFVQTVLEYSQ
ncbi:MAG: phosphoribosylaminoimidazolesuccinocarboxamide synthase [Planctomycetota bacterium]|nr:MAG: phosphoribosylaminoimidazolesuccinocarboxamide synthase [Planctomycetota bacterium]